MTKKCVISNYIPHKTPKNPNFYRWYENYKNNLLDIYNIYVNTLRSRYPNINFSIFETDEYFNLFINRIFDSSSKTIIER